MNKIKLISVAILAVCLVVFFSAWQQMGVFDLTFWLVAIISCALLTVYFFTHGDEDDE